MRQFAGQTLHILYLKIYCIIIGMKNFLKQVLENDDSIFIDSKSIRKM